MILSDVDIFEQQHRSELRAGVGVQKMIDPFVAEQVQPASYDLRLGDMFRALNHRGGLLDPLVEKDWTTALPPSRTGQVILEPGKLLLAATVERIHLPPDLAGRVEGKSSLARLGLVVHTTAGFIDPGFDGEITLELTTVVKPFVLHCGMVIAQLAFQQCSRPARNPYDGKYQRQMGPQPSQYFRNYPEGRIT